MSKYFFNNPRIVRSIQPKINKCQLINIRIKQFWAFSFFIFSDNPVPYRVPVQSNLFYSRAYYTCIGNETTLNKCKKGYLKSCSNQSGEQIGISCESKYCIIPFQLLNDKWIFSFAHRKSRSVLHTLQINNLLTLWLIDGDTLAGFSVYVSDTPDWKSGALCYQHDINEPVDNNVSIDCLTTGRYVTIYNSRNGSLLSTQSSFAYINICEVNITGKSYVIHLIVLLYISSALCHRWYIKCVVIIIE